MTHTWPVMVFQPVCLLLPLLACLLLPVLPPAAGAPGSSCSAVMAALCGAKAATLCDACASQHQHQLRVAGCTSAEVQQWCAQQPGAASCDARAAGAKGDNKTDDTRAIQGAIDTCREQHPLGAVVLLRGPATYRITASIALGSNLTLQVRPLHAHAL